MRVCVRALWEHGSLYIQLYYTYCVSLHAISSNAPSGLLPSLTGCCVFAGVTMAYVNPSLTGHKTSATVDARQREYLLDMIPSRASISQTANTWK